MSIHAVCTQVTFSNLFLSREYRERLRWAQREGGRRLIGRWLSIHLSGAAALRWFGYSVYVVLFSSDVSISLRIYMYIYIHINETPLGKHFYCQDMLALWSVGTCLWPRLLLRTLRKNIILITTIPILTTRIIEVEGRPPIGDGATARLSWTDCRRRREESICESKRERLPLIYISYVH